MADGVVYSKGSLCRNRDDVLGKQFSGDLLCFCVLGVELTAFVHPVANSLAGTNKCLPSVLRVGLLTALDDRNIGQA